MKTAMSFLGRQLVRLGYLAIIALMVFGLGYAAFGEQITGVNAEASNQDAAWQAHVKAVKVSDGSLLFEADIVTRTDFGNAAFPGMCEPFILTSDVPLTADVDYSVTMDGVAHGFSEDFAVPQGNSNWDVEHPQGNCSISLDNPATAQVVTLSTTPTAASAEPLVLVTATPEGFKAHVKITDAAGVVLFEGDLTHRTEFHETDLPWACDPITIVSDQPLKGDSDLTNVVNGTEYGFAESWYLQANVPSTIDVPSCTRFLTPVQTFSDTKKETPRIFSCLCY